MDDQLDNDLKNHIRDVFDKYEDTTADEGWLLLREKFPAKARRRPLVWLWWSAAAVLLGVLAIVLWNNTKPVKPGNEIVKKVEHQPQQQKQAVKRMQADTTSRFAGAMTAGQNKRAGGSGRAQVNPSQAYQGGLTPGVTAVTATGALPVAATHLQADSAAKSSLLVRARADSARQSNKNTPVTQLAAAIRPPAADARPAFTPQKNPARTITDMFNADKGANVTKAGGEKASKKVIFAVYAGTYFNYSKGSDNQVNVGGGVTSDIRISDNLKLVTGITIAQNSMSYAAIPTQAASIKSNLAPAPAAGLYSPQRLVSSPTVKNYNASLVGLDIPINLKYEFNPKKTDAYISLGLSSGTFIDESYTYKYNYPSFLSSSLQATRDETTGNNFNSFYFARTLNVAIGLGYPFGKNRLVIEPFLKYPLDGLGTQNLRFGAGGLNLKFNFLSSHK